VSPGSRSSERILLPDRLTGIDETNRDQHIYLEAGDRCFFFGEYFAGKGYQGSGTNQLMFNFKCTPSDAAANPGRKAHKERAVAAIAAGLRKAMTRENVERLTFVPIPPSKVAGHADYDDRLMRTLLSAFDGYDSDVRLLLRQVSSTGSDHTAADRLSADALAALIQIDGPCLSARPLRQGIVVFDDVLTSGKHFKCCERRLREVVPASVPIIGVFVARRILREASG
jgi:hypothetical protein